MVIDSAEHYWKLPMCCDRSGNGFTFYLMLQALALNFSWTTSKKSEEDREETMLLLRSSFRWHPLASRCGTSYCPPCEEYYCMAVVTL